MGKMRAIGHVDRFRLDLSGEIRERIECCVDVHLTPRAKLYTTAFGCQYMHDGCTYAARATGNDCIETCELKIHGTACLLGVATDLVVCIKQAPERGLKSHVGHIKTLRL
jgi:hypothetical protein